MASFSQIPLKPSVESSEPKRKKLKLNVTTHDSYATTTSTAVPSPHEMPLTTSPWAASPSSVFDLQTNEMMHLATENRYPPLVQLKNLEFDSVLAMPRSPFPSTYDTSTMSMPSTPFLYTDNVSSTPLHSHSIGNTSTSFISDSNNKTNIVQPADNAKNDAGLSQLSKTIKVHRLDHEQNRRYITDAVRKPLRLHIDLLRRRSIMLRNKLNTVLKTCGFNPNSTGGTTGNGGKKTSKKKKDEESVPSTPVTGNIMANLPSSPPLTASIVLPEKFLVDQNFLAYVNTCLELLESTCDKFGKYEHEVDVVQQRNDDLIDNMGNDLKALYAFQISHQNTFPNKFFYEWQLQGSSPFPLG